MPMIRGVFPRVWAFGLLAPRFKLLVTAAVLAGCVDSGTPAYVRLAGDAPKVTDVPPSRAQLVVFWASWCAPCRDESPSLRKLADNPPPDLAVVVLAHDESPADSHGFFGGEPPASWHLRADPEKVVARAFGVETLPASFVVVDGRLKARFSGPRDWDSTGMRRLLERLIVEGAPAR